MQDRHEPRPRSCASHAATRCHRSSAGTTSSRNSGSGSASWSTRTAVARTGGWVIPLVATSGAPSQAAEPHSSGPGRVVGIGDVEDDVRDHPVSPLAAEQRSNLRSCTRRVDACEPDRDQCGVPVPLVRIEVATGPDEARPCRCRRGRHGLARSGPPRSASHGRAHSVRRRRQRRRARVPPPPDGR